MSKIVRLGKFSNFSSLPARDSNFRLQFLAVNLSFLRGISIKPVVILRLLDSREVYLQASSPHGLLGSYRLFFLPSSMCYKSVDGFLGFFDWICVILVEFKLNVWVDLVDFLVIC